MHCNPILKPKQFWNSEESRFPVASDSVLGWKHRNSIEDLRVHEPTLPRQESKAGFVWHESPNLSSIKLSVHFIRVVRLIKYKKCINKQRHVLLVWGLEIIKVKINCSFQTERLCSHTYIIIILCYDVLSSYWYIIYLNQFVINLKLTLKLVKWFSTRYFLSDLLCGKFWKPRSLKQQLSGETTESIYWLTFSWVTSTIAYNSEDDEVGHIQKNMWAFRVKIIHTNMEN